MVRIGLYSLVLTGLLLLVLLATGSWLLHTATGTRWALTHLPAWAGAELRIGRIDGTLAGRLQVDDVEADFGGVQVQFGRLVMETCIRGLLPILLDIKQLHLDRLQVQTPQAGHDAPSGEFRWPQPPRLAGWLQLDIGDLELRDFSWRQEGRPLQQLELLRADLHWLNGRLQVGQLVLRAADLQGQGSFRLDLGQPRLELAARIDAVAPSAAWRQLQVKADLQPGSAGQLLHGPVALDFTGGQGDRLTASAELGLTADSLLFQDLQLSRPGRSGRIAADGRLRFSGGQPELSVALQFDRLDLQSETGQPLQLSGTLQGQGGLDGYSGRFELSNPGAELTAVNLAGEFVGNRQEISLDNLHGTWLSGTIGGQVDVNWQDGWQVGVHLTSDGIDPRALHSRLAGQLNLELQADLAGGKGDSPHGRVQVDLRDSILHGQSLTGEARLQLQENTVQIEQLQLLGEGLLLQVSGDLAERLAVDWHIEQLEQVLPDASGQFSGQGWLRWDRRLLAGEVTAEGQGLGYHDWQLGTLNLQGQTLDAAGGPWKLQFDGRMLRGPQPDLAVDRIEADLQGTLADHRLTLKLVQQHGSASASLAGGWLERQWRGELTGFMVDEARIGRWYQSQAVAIVAAEDLVSIDPLSLHSDNAGALQLQGSYRPALQEGRATLAWQDLDLSLLRPWLDDWRIAGQGSGSLELERGEQDQLRGHLIVSGELARQQLQLRLSRSEMQFDWARQGLQASLQLQLADGGNLAAILSSPQPADFTLPQQGALQLTGRDFPLTMLHPWLPPALNLSGTLGLSAEGRWRVDEAFTLEGRADTGGGRFFWEDDDGIISADITAAELTWQWQDRLQGDLALQLSEQGRIKANFDLPLAARLPLEFEPAGGVNADLNARLQERGLLSVLFPGRIQESRGQLDLDLQLAGTWQNPRLQGDFHLSDSGVFLPTLGVQLKEIDLLGEFADNRVEIVSLQLKSGGGLLRGSGRMQLEDWQPGTYRAQLEGENFQLINLPEMQVRTNPELVIDGNGRQIRVRGQLEFPDVLISGKQKTGLASNSPDLVVVDREIPVSRQSRLQHDVDIELILGDRVLLDTAGIDARLEGRLRLQSTDSRELAANGTFRVAKGKYSSYGVNLGITRGALYFTGGPIDQPTLDILAIRKVGEVQAGVKVTGTPKKPVVQLYSEPAMADTDILSYIVLGRPVGADQSEAGLLMTAAGALLSQGESATLQEKLKGRLGLDVLDISAGEGDVTSSVVTTGKYLSPDLYISLGYSLFTNTNEFKVRYSITPTWEIESSFGIESGVDMYYRIEIE